MMSVRPKVLLAFSPRVYEGYVDPAVLARLEQFADCDFFPCEGGGIYDSNRDPAASAALREKLAGYDGIVICHGAPALTAEVLENAPKLRFIGELEGDRFASRIDLDAAWERNIRTVDVTNGSSYPVAEWALGLILVSLRNGGEFFRRILAGEGASIRYDKATVGGQLTGKRVGLIGGGHMARRLIKLLQPFETEIWVHDPYLPREMAEALGFIQTSLDNVLSQCDVVVCLVPLTPATKGMLGEREFALLKPGAVFVNVSRGPVADSQALVERLKQGDIVAGLDVFDPEPIPAGNEILQLPNVFLSPHIGWATGDPIRPFFALMVDELKRFFEGHEPWYELTPRSRANRTGQRAT
ncbi:MAG: hydroxyacid dehydrogenase [Caldilineaceae bacterium]|nr:hydroxyacid dehydrogenase [Caldilineaceae bacterium]